jgi:hypothetical protein
VDKWQALHSFFASFQIPAYDEASVPDDAQTPYITYSAAIDSLDSPVTLTANLWYKSTSWAAISQKAEEIEARLKHGGIVIQIDGGRLWLTKGSPFAQRTNLGLDNYKNIYIVIQGEFLAE